MDNKKKLLIGGGIAAAIIILIVLFVVFGKDDAKENGTTTSAQSTSGVTEEITTLKENSTEDTNEETSSEIVEESSDEETTSAVIEESSEETTIKTAAVVDKEITTKKGNSTIKKNETTTKKQTSKETTTKKQTTTAKQTTTKQETTTQEQTTAKPKPQSGRIKECELEFINKCLWFYPDNVNRGSIYTDLGNKFNPFIEQRDVFGWDNVAFLGGWDINHDEKDYFAVNYPDNEYEQRERREVYILKKYNEGIIQECNEWINDSTKYGMGKMFGEYLCSRYTYNGSKNIFAEEKTGKWYEDWCYYDTVLKKYQESYEKYELFTSVTFIEEGYYTDVDKIYNRISEMEEESITDTCFVYCRWIYDENTDKTTIYIVGGY